MPRTTTRAPDPDWTDPECPVARTLDLVGDRWSLLVVRDAMDGARSFTEFQRRTGIARNILTDRLRKLTAHGLLAQRTAPSGRRQEYVLTDSRPRSLPGHPHPAAVGRAPRLRPRRDPLHPCRPARHPRAGDRATAADGTPLGTETTHVQKTR